MRHPTPRPLVLVLVLVLVLLAVAGSSAATLPVEDRPALTHAGDVAVLPELDALYRRFVRAYRERDATAVGRLYSPDALYLSPGADIVRFRPVIEARFRRMFQAAATDGQDLAISFHLMAREVSGRLAYDVGTYSFDRLEGGVVMSHDTGKFVVVHRRGEDGRWTFQVDGYSGLPAPGPEPTTP